MSPHDYDEIMKDLLLLSTVITIREKDMAMVNLAEVSAKIHQRMHLTCDLWTVDVTMDGLTTLKTRSPRDETH